MAPEQERFDLRLSPPLASKLRTLAAGQHRSVNAQLTVLIEDACKPPRKPPASRATRLPDDWKVTEAMVGWARSSCPHVGTLETQKFENFWRAKAGASAAKRDWLRTWQNWMIRAEETWASQHAPKPSTTDQRVAEGRRLADELRRQGR